MLCTQCKSELRLGAKFCGHCGKKVDTDALGGDSEAEMAFIGSSIKEWLLSKGMQASLEIKPDGNFQADFEFDAVGPAGSYGLSGFITVNEEIKMLSVVASPSMLIIPEKRMEEVAKFCGNFTKEHGNIYPAGNNKIAYVHSRSIDSFKNGVADIKKELTVIFDEMGQHVGLLAPYIVQIANNQLDSATGITKIGKSLQGSGESMLLKNNDKTSQIKSLALLRSRDDLSLLSRSYKHVGDFHGGIYDTWELVSPWSKSACNTGSDVMIIGQDWYSEDAINKSIDPFTLGYNPDAPTNKNLFILLKDKLNRNFSDVYATNIFVFVKEGGASATIPRSDLIYSAKKYTLEEIKIVSPKAIICLGSETYNTICRAAELEPRPFKVAFKEPIVYKNSLIFGVPHTGTLGTNNAGGMHKVLEIWEQLAELLAHNQLPLESTHNNEITPLKEDDMNQKTSIPPDVIPTTQVEQDKDGNSIVKKFKPLAYSLLCWIKSKGMPDQINLNVDSSEAEYSFTMDSHDPGFKYQCFFNLDEGSGLIKYYIYFFDEHFDADDFDVLKLLAEINLMLPVGQFQFVETNSGHVLRYYASVSVQGIASDDLEYEGPFQIHPFLYDRLFSIGADCMNRYIESFRTGDIDTVGIRLSDSSIDSDENSSESENSWISADTKPEKEGKYEATIDKVGWPNPMPSVINAYWNTKKWIDNEGKNVKIKYWRKSE